MREQTIETQTLISDTSLSRSTIYCGSVKTRMSYNTEPNAPHIEECIADYIRGKKYAA